MNQRMHRLQDLIRSELSNILQRDIRDPRVGMATVSAIRVSRDLSHAEVLVSVLGDDEETRLASIEALDRAKGFIRSTLARRIQLRTVPNLVFKLDRGAEHSQKISAILENLHDDESTSS